MKNHQEEKTKLKHWHGIVSITCLLFLLLLFLEQEEGDRNTGKRGKKKEEEEKKKGEKLSRFLDIPEALDPPSGPGRGPG